MDNPNNNQFNQNSQFPQSSQLPQSGVPQNMQYRQNPQYREYAQPTQTQTVSKGEMFVGMNILSKIGVIFILIGVIAFSAVSEDYLPAWARMGLVLALGVIMLICGDLFRRKNSPIFANALTYGAVAELFISVLIGRYGFGVWNGTVAQVIGLVVAALGILLSLRYKSQPLLIVTQIFATLPAFACGRNAASVAISAFCLMAGHAAVAIISRRKDYTGAYITGICLAFVHSCIVAVQAERIGYLDIALNDQTFVYSTFVIVFALCVAVCYAGGVLLNAAESDGTMFAWEITGTILSLASTALVIHFVLVSACESIKVSGIGDIVFALVLAVIAVIFALRFGKRCSTVSAISNIVLGCLVLSVFMLAEGVAVYVVLHVMAVAVLTLGLFIERKLFMGWGIALLILSEFAFFQKLGEDGAERIIAIIVNLVLWFVVMGIYIVRKKHETTLFKVYTCLAFLNAGILGCSLILKDLFGALKEASFTGAECRLLCSLICACIWMIMGFAIGKAKYLGGLSMGFSITFYAIGMGFLFFTNLIHWGAASKEYKFAALFVVVTIIVNIISVLTVLDLTMQITAKAPKFAKAVGLVVSSYGLASLTSVLGMNNTVKFTSWIISIIYIVMAAVWIVVGFKKRNALLRRFGLALALLASAKLFLFDFHGIDAMGRTLLFIGFGVTLLVISFGYGIAEKRLKERDGK
ncbi:MAG: DUF2339 domain-containing protein [Oscillospiraceae bacterium]